MTPLAGASVTVYETGTTTPLAVPIYAGPSGSDLLLNPLTADANGVVDFWLDADETVDLLVAATGYGAATATVDVTTQTALTGPTITNANIVNPSILGNLIFATGAGQRLTGDFSHATVGSRVLFQSSTLNGGTIVGAVPNGTNTVSGFQVHNAADANNAGRVRLVVSGVDALIQAQQAGTGLIPTSLDVSGFTGGLKKDGVVLNSTVQACLANATVPAATTQFSAPSAGSAVATEAQRQTPIPRATTIRNLFLTTGAAQPGDGTLVATLRKNSVDTALTLTVGAGAAGGGFSDVTHAVTFAAGDLMSLKLVNGSPGTVSASVIGWSVTLDA